MSNRVHLFEITLKSSSKKNDFELFSHVHLLTLTPEEHVSSGVVHFLQLVRR